MSAQRLVRRRRWAAIPPRPGCQALLPHAGAEPPHTPPLGSAARKVEGLFPARPSERSHAAEPVKAKPFGWRAKGTRASLDRTCRAPEHGNYLAGKMPQAQASQAPAWPHRWRSRWSRRHTSPWRSGAGRRHTRALSRAPQRAPARPCAGGHAGAAGPRPLRPGEQPEAAPALRPLPRSQSGNPR